MDQPESIHDKEPGMLESFLLLVLTGGECDEPGLVYKMLKNQASRRSLYRRGELMFCLFYMACIIIISRVFGGIRWIVFGGYFALMGWAGIASWTFTRQLRLRGCLDELAATPLKPKKTLQDIGLFGAYMYLIPLMVWWASYIALLLKRKTTSFGLVVDVATMISEFPLIWIFSMIGGGLGMGHSFPDIVRRVIPRGLVISFFYPVAALIVGGIAIGVAQISLTAGVIAFAAGIILLVYFLRWFHVVEKGQSPDKNSPHKQSKGKNPSAKSHEK